MGWGDVMVICVSFQRENKAGHKRKGILIVQFLCLSDSSLISDAHTQIAKPLFALPVS